MNYYRPKIVLSTYLGSHGAAGLGCDMNVVYRINEGYSERWAIKSVLGNKWSFKNTKLSCCGITALYGVET